MDINHIRSYVGNDPNEVQVVISIFIEDIHPQLEKLLMDRTLFNSDTPDELIHFRHELFLFTARLHAQDDNCDLETYYQRIEKQFDETIDSIQDRLYSDLPVHQPVTQFKALSAKRLLHRYNCAQVQGLLIHCARLVVKIFHPEPASLRQLFKYLRFHVQ
jgi:Uncharacterized conserved protein